MGAAIAADRIAEMLRSKRLVIGWGSSGSRLRTGASDHQTPRGFEIFSKSRVLRLSSSDRENTRRAFSRGSAADWPRLGPPGGMPMLATLTTRFREPKEIAKRTREY